LFALRVIIIIIICICAITIIVFITSIITSIISIIIAGTMSVTEALKFFSTETVVAAKAGATNEKVLRDMEAYSNFLQPLNDSSPSV